MKHEQPRLLIAGTGSGCGKTTVSSALLRAWQRQGVDLCAFKCGPDYIDPMFHREALGLPSYNLDLFFLQEQEVCELLSCHLSGGRVGVVEGVMGFYDGMGTTDEASAAHVARATQTPAVLVVRPKGQALSLAAMISGFTQFAENTIRGVILNGVTAGMYPFYRDIVQKAGVCVYGYLPPVPEAELPERHLGLVTAGELPDLHRQLDLLADAACEGLDLKGLLELACSAPPLAPPVPKGYEKTSVRIAVAQDAAFCFYYQDNLDLLTELGAQLIPFSPLSDAQLPDNIDGLYLGGGYPELYTEQIAQNVTMRDSIRRHIETGTPVIAECGGFIYLGRELVKDAQAAPMAGVLPIHTELTHRLQNFGYIALTAQKDTMLCEKGQTLRAHEFHYSKSDNAGDAFTAQKRNGKQWQCVFANEHMYAGYPHLYFRGQISVVQRFLRTCMEMRHKDDFGSMQTSN